MVYCDGRCASWLHRRCAGLTKAGLDQLEGTSDKFYCLSCTVAMQQREIANLKALITDLSSKVSTLENKISVPPTGKSLLCSDVMKSGPSNAKEAVKSVPSKNDSTALSIKEDRLPDVPKPQQEKKFNGIDECRKGTHFAERSIQDSKAVLSVISTLDPSLTTVSIQDTSRLGKYQPTSSHSRPLLVKFNGAGDVMAILAKRRNLSHAL